MKCLNQRRRVRFRPTNGRNGKQRQIALFASRERFRGVRASGNELRAWLREFPVCQALGQHQILHVGVAKTSAPLGFALTEQDRTCFVACFGGAGRVRVDGRWYPCGAGTGCLLPAHTMDMLPDEGGKPWEFCWACYDQPPERQFASAAAAPMLARFDPVPLRCAIEGLAHECSRDAVPTDIQHWVDLIQDYVMRFVHRGDADERLGQLWERVNAQLDGNWNLTRLAREAGYSYGHLRRLCLRQLGRSPMHQVTYLRMRRAAELLSSTHFKIEAVAQAVGYTNPFVFSNAFRRWIGWRPSEYRRKHAENSASAG